MKQISNLLVIFVAWLVVTANVSAQEEIADVVEVGCAAETEAYCSDVTLGEGRLLACYYAHEDKLSGECVTALYKGFAILRSELDALSHVAEQCSSDIDQHCAETELGEGRIAKCLGYHSEELSETCSTAIEEYLD